MVPNQCDAVGNIERLGKGIMGYPKYKYGYIKHYVYKTAEEFAALKLKRGHKKGVPLNLDISIDYFSKVNNLTEEKLDLIEHIINKTLPKYHKNNNIN